MQKSSIKHYHSESNSTLKKNHTPSSVRIIQVYQGCFNIWKSTSFQLTKWSIKSSQQMQKSIWLCHPGGERQTSLTKNVNKLDIEGIYIDIIKAIYNKPTVIILKSKKIESFSSRIRDKIRGPSVIFPNIVPVLARNKVRKTYAIQNGKKLNYFCL